MRWVKFVLAENESHSTRICVPNLVAVRRSCRKRGVQTDRQTDKWKLQLYIIEGNVLIYLEIAMNTVHCVGPNMVNMASTQLKFEFYQKHILANGESGSHDW